MELSHTTYFVSRWTHRRLIEWGVPAEWVSYINTFILLVLTLIVIYITYRLLKFILRTAFGQIAKATNISFFRCLNENHFFKRISLLLPYIVIRYSMPVIFADFSKIIKPLDILTDVCLVFIVIGIIMSLIKSCFDVLQEKPAFHDKPMTSYLQVIKMVLILFGIVVVFSIVTGKSPTAFFAAMGAASAVLLLMFKDSIMGFVASIQVTSNDMVRLGDWITMPKYGADGDVIEINLTTVKVRNFDKTITTMPTYALISDSFQNWRGMQASGGRRIKRSIIIKQNSIRFIKDEELVMFRKIQGIATYIEERQAEIEAHNKRIGADRSIPVNGRNMTNAGLFRKYAEWYLKSHPGTNKDMTLMVRQLAPAENGLPFELYVFTNTIEWASYEYIMADIFDHLIASVPFFDLQIFELPAGNDIRKVEILHKSNG